MNETRRFEIDRARTPIGELVVIVDGAGRLCSLDWTDHEPRMRALLRRYHGERLEFAERNNPAGMTAAMVRYFEGDVRVIDDLAVETGGTPFQRAVWSALREIPCGTTWSYAELARHIGRPSAVRAVGLANGSNPVAIVVPCHRVIGSNGTLTGYGGGLHRKRWLLSHEGVALHAEPLALAL